MANQDFEEAVAAATAQASVSRKQLGCSYAAEFKQNPDVFDPRKLIALGREGLLSIVTTVSVPTCGLEHRISSEREMPYRRACGYRRSRPYIPTRSRPGIPIGSRPPLASIAWVDLMMSLRDEKVK